jgi:polyvinyl alcohol dehydrogenase (cytochrome)
LLSYVAAADWRMANHDPSGNHIQPDETAIGTANVGRLPPRWTLTVAGIVNATPAVVNGAVYFPDSEARSGRSMPRTQGDLVRFSAGIDRDRRDLLAHETGLCRRNGVHRRQPRSGSDRRRRRYRNETLDDQLDAHPSALLTSSPVVVGDCFYMPVSSNEQRAAAKPGYACCTF